MNKNEFEKQSMLSAKGLVWNSEQAEATRIMTKMFITAYDEASKTKPTVEALAIAGAMVKSVMQGAQNGGGSHD